MISQGLARTRHNKSRLARELGISRSNLILKIAKYGLDEARHRERRARRGGGHRLSLAPKSRLLPPGLPSDLRRRAALVPGAGRRRALGGALRRARAATASSGSTSGAVWPRPPPGAALALPRPRPVGRADGRHAHRRRVHLRRSGAADGRTPGGARRCSSATRWACRWRSSSTAATRTASRGWCCCAAATAPRSTPGTTTRCSAAPSPTCATWWSGPPASRARSPPALLKTELAMEFGLRTELNRDAHRPQGLLALPRPPGEDGPGDASCARSTR